MADVKKLTTADRTPAWIDREIVKKAKEIAAREESSLSEVLESLIRKPLEKKHERIFSPADLGENGGA